MKNANDTIGNRTRDLPAYSAVPQPTAPPGDSYCIVQSINTIFNILIAFFKFDSLPFYLWARGGAVG